VPTKQIKINIHKQNNTKNTVQTVQKHSKYKYKYYQNTHTKPPHAHPYITKQVKTTTVQDTSK
jgi:hypothetical protein